MTVAGRIEKLYNTQRSIRPQPQARGDGRIEQRRDRHGCHCHDAQIRRFVHRLGGARQVIEHPDHAHHRGGQQRWPCADAQYSVCTIQVVPPAIDDIESVNSCTLQPFQMHEFDPLEVCQRRTHQQADCAIAVAAECYVAPPELA